MYICIYIMISIIIIIIIIMITTIIISISIKYVCIYIYIYNYTDTCVYAYNMRTPDILMTPSLDSIIGPASMRRKTRLWACRISREPAILDVLVMCMLLCLMCIVVFSLCF